MPEFRLQLGVAALPDITAVVAHDAGQVGIIGALRLGAVVQHQLHLGIVWIDDCSPGQSREPVAVVPGNVVCRRDGILVVIMHILVAHPGAELSGLRQVETIIDKAGVVVLYHRGLRGRNVNAADGVVVAAAGKGLLRSGLQLSLPYRIGKDGLYGIHPPIRLAAGADGAACRHVAGFFRFRVAVIACSVVVKIHVNAQFSADYSVVIKVGSQIVDSSVTHSVIGDRGNFVGQRTVQPDIVVHYCAYVILQRLSPLYFSAKEMIVGHLPVHAGIAIKALAEVVVEEVSVVFQQERFPEGLLLQVALLTGGIAGIVDATENVNAAGAVIHIQRTERIVSLVPAQRLLVLRIEVEAEAVALAANGADTDYASH